MTASPRRPPSSATTCRHSRTTPPRSGPPPARCPGVSSFQIHFADTDILTPGDQPEVLIAMNPAALKANLRDLKAGGTIVVNTDEFTKRNLTKVGYDANPLEDGSLDDYQVHAVALATLTIGALAEHEVSEEGRRALEEHVRARPRLVDVLAPDRGDRGVPARQVQGQARHRRGEHRRAAGRLELRRHHRGVRRALRDPAGEAQRGHLPEHHRQPGPGLGHHRRRCGERAPGVPGRVPDHPGQRHPPRAVEAQALRRHHRAGRRRDRRRRCGPRRLVGRGARRHHLLGPGHRAQVGDDLARRLAGAAAPRRRRAARRALDRVCRPRPSRPTS